MNFEKNCVKLLFYGGFKLRYFNKLHHINHDHYNKYDHNNHDVIIINMITIIVVQWHKRKTVNATVVDSILGQTRKQRVSSKKSSVTQHALPPEFGGGTKVS